MNIDLMNYLKGELKDFTWYTKTISTDSTGMQTAMLTEAGTGKGDLQPVMERIIRAEAGQDVRTTNVLFTNAELAIRAGDIIEIDGVKYNVKEVLEYTTHKEIHLYAHS